VRSLGFYRGGSLVAVVRLPSLDPVNSYSQEVDLGASTGFVTPNVAVNLSPALF